MKKYSIEFLFNNLGISFRVDNVPAPDEDTAYMNAKTMMIEAMDIDIEALAEKLNENYWMECPYEEEDEEE